MNNGDLPAAPDHVVQKDKIVGIAGKINEFKCISEPG
jgi:hypothetical protein